MNVLQVQVNRFVSNIVKYIRKIDPATGAVSVGLENWEHVTGRTATVYVHVFDKASKNIKYTVYDCNLKSLKQVKQRLLEAAKECEANEQLELVVE